MAFKVLKNNRFFLIPYLVVLTITGAVLLYFPKAEIHLWINQFHSPFFDRFFRFVTFLGDGWFVTIPVVLLLFVSLRDSVYVLVSYLATGLVAQIMKRFVFEDCARPIRFFHDKAALHLVDGVKMLQGHSFPSGHATSSFALFLALAVVSRNRALQAACFVIATVVAFSRIYLSQHFLIDVAAGSVIGTAGAFAFAFVFYRSDRNWHGWNLQHSLHDRNS
jgi:membrane-associated phospholipid phosphatase